MQRTSIPPTPLTSFLIGVAIALSACSDRGTEAASNTSSSASPHSTAQASSSSADSSTDAASLREFAGAPARAVWVRSVDPAHRDTFLEHSQHTLMALDSEGGGERVLMGDVTNYRKPMITPDGQRVVYSNYTTSECFVIPFAGGTPQKLSDGLAATVRDEAGETVVYALLNIEPNSGQCSGDQLVRFPLDNPAAAKVVFNGTRVSLDNLQFGRTGKKFAATIPWPYAGIVDLETGKWEQVTRGCWAGLAPDDSGIYWIFDGPHHGVTMISPEEGKTWNVKLNSRPELAGTEVYHPRWSNDPRRIALTGPYNQDAGGMMAVFAGGPNVEVWLARFDPTLDHIDQWFRLTNNNSADFGPDLWIEGANTSSLDLAAVIADKPAGGAIDRLVGQGWIPDTTNLALLWESGNATNLIEFSDVSGATKSESIRVEPHGLARFGPNSEIILGGGSGEATGAAVDAASSRIAKSSEFSIEFSVTSRHVSNNTPGVLMSLGNGATGQNLIFLQAGPKLFASIRGGLTGSEPGKAIPIAMMAQDAPTHIALTGEPGRLKIFINGQFTGRIEAAGFAGDFSSWEPGPLTLGHAPGGGSDWAGSVSHIALYDSVLAEESIFAKAEIIGAVQRGIAAQPSSQPPIAVTGRLVAMSSYPTLEGIGSYVRSLVVYTYEISPEDAPPEIAGKQVNVKHWSILDKTFTAGFPRELDRPYPLLLAPAEARPEISSEHTSSFDSKYDLLPEYLDLTPSRFPAPQ